MCFSRITMAIDTIFGQKALPDLIERFLLSVRSQIRSTYFEMETPDRFYAVNKKKCKTTHKKYGDSRC